MPFSHLGLADVLLKAIDAAGYTRPTPIQDAAIPPALAGRDVFGSAQTGTGKTAAFVLPILHQLAAQQSRRRPAPIRALILTPTRELAAQIDQSIRTYARGLRLFHGVIHGGVPQGPQVRALRKGLDIVVACPGRLLDLIDQGHVDLGAVRHFVLDEADRMLDMGFIHDVERICSRLPAQRQTLFFSATTPKDILALANDILDDPEHVRITPPSSAAETVEQRVYHVDRTGKLPLLKMLLADEAVSRVLVFTRTKHGADKIVKQLTKAAIDSAAIHGNKTQGARTRALAAFRRGATRVLVASDIAARGLDVHDITHVINFELPHEAETYVHRIGRTGRAGRGGQAISFCDSDERPRLRNIQRLIRQNIPVVDGHPWELQSRPPVERDRAPAGARSPQARRGSGQRKRRPVRR